MLPDQVSNPGPLTYESGALPIARRGPASLGTNIMCDILSNYGVPFLLCLTRCASTSFK